MADRGDELRDVWIIVGTDAVAGGDAETINDWLANKLDNVRGDGWFVLYRHRDSGQFWELSYPQGEMHGGGARLLTCLGDTPSGRWSDIAQGSRGAKPPTAAQGAGSATFVAADTPERFLADIEMQANGRKG
jgi:hypothetical protein